MPSLEQCGLVACAKAGEEFHTWGSALGSNLAAVADDQAEFETRFGPQHRMARWTEIGQLCVATGERTKLAVAALREAAGMLNSADPDNPYTVPLRAGFVIEGALQYFVGVGHSLANIGLRIALENESSEAHLSKVGRRTSIARARAATPGSISPDAWLFHSDAAKAAEALRGSSTPPAKFLRTVARLYVAPDWSSANRARNDYFHRWSEGFASADTTAFAAAEQLLMSALRAAGCLGRAAPSLYCDLVASVPKVRFGQSRGFPLMGMMYSGLDPDQMRPSMVSRRFYR